MISLLTAGAFSIAVMMNFFADNSAALFSPSTDIAQAQIESSSTASHRSTDASAGATENAPTAASMLMSASLPRLAIIAVLAMLPFVSVLLILLSRWRIPGSPPIGVDPARYLRRTLL